MSKMIINGTKLLSAAPIKNISASKTRAHGVSSGLGEAGYDIRLQQTICFFPSNHGGMLITVDGSDTKPGHFTLASAIEEFQMPNNMVGVVHDKSTWARRGLSVFNTVIEPGWQGFLTLELVYHGNDTLVLPAGCGIAQVLFSQLAVQAAYSGKYQHQVAEPIQSIFDRRE